MSVIITNLVLISILLSCQNNVNNRDSKDNGSGISQQNDGSYLLKLEDAVCYSDQVNPSIKVFVKFLLNLVKSSLADIQLLLNFNK